MYVHFNMLIYENWNSQLDISGYKFYYFLYLLDTNDTA